MTKELELLQSIATRRKTVRRFTTEKPPLELVYKALDTACQAPSGSNTQPWRFMIVEDPVVKSRIREAAETGEKVFYETISAERKKKYNAMGHTWKKPMLEKAPILLVVAADATAPNFRPSVWLAVGYLVLALEAVGLGSVTYTPSEAELVRKALGIPDEYTLETILPLGYPADPKDKAPRKPAKELTRVNYWGVPGS